MAALPKTVALASDHAGFEMKSALKAELDRLGYEVLDLGTNNEDSVDYPDYAAKMARAIREGQAERGVLVCGSGIGISIAANRFPEIRAALCHDNLTVRLARQHNDANVLAMGGRLLGETVAIDCLHAFLETPFEGGRHERRVAKLSQMGGMLSSS